MTKPIDYQALQHELDEILVQLQSGESDVNGAIKLYERGREIITLLEKYLKHAENKIKKLPS